MKKGEKLIELKKSALQGGGAEKIAKQHKAGKLTARERIDLLCDKGSFVELDQFLINKLTPSKDAKLGDGLISGVGTINGREIALFSQDFTIFGGSLSLANAHKITKVMDLALKLKIPIIGINDSGGARIQEGVESLAGYAEVFYRNVNLSGIIPQISLVLGPCAGGAVYSPAITDFILMAQKTSYMFITGPDVIHSVTREKVDKESLGGADLHAQKSGVTHLVAKDDSSVIDLTKTLLSYLPQSCYALPDHLPCKDPVTRNNQVLLEIIPELPSKPYDMRKVTEEIVDKNSLFELAPEFASNIITAFARLNGDVIGIVANQPKHLAGCLDINASAKAARFVRFCDCFNIPLLTLVDVPGFLPGLAQEHGGIIRHGAKLLYAYAEATVPKVTIICRKAYGGAYDVMSSKHIGGDINFAFPTAEIAVMGPEAAIELIHRDTLSQEKGEALYKLKNELVKEYRESFANPWIAAGCGYLDAVIEASETRSKLAWAFKTLSKKLSLNRGRKHGNIPL